MTGTAVQPAELSLRRTAMRWLVALLAMGLVFGLFSVWANHVTRVPLDMSVTLRPGSLVDTTIDLPVPERYRLELSFKRDPDGPPRVEGLVGQSAPGIALPVAWSVTDMAGRLRASGHPVSARATSWSSNDIDRTLGTFQIPAGRYRLRIKQSGAVPELRGIPVRVRLHVPGKSAATWQMGAVWWGSLIALIALPFSFLAAVLHVGGNAISLALKRRRDLSPRRVQ